MNAFWPGYIDRFLESGSQKNPRADNDVVLPFLEIGFTADAEAPSTADDAGNTGPAARALFGLDRDYFTVSEDQIKHVSSVLTVMDGRVVFGAQDYSALSPSLPDILPVWSRVKTFGGYYGAK